MHAAGTAAETFIVTKPQRSVWEKVITHFKPLPEGFQKQLEWLRRDSVDILMYHHPDDDNSTVYWETWRGMERQVDAKKAGALGHTGVPKWHQWARYRHKPVLMERSWSPCGNIFTKHPWVTAAQAHNV